MKKMTIATLALSASTSFALVGPNPPGAYDTKTYCLNKYEDAQGAVSVGTCDESQNNQIRGEAFNSQGCMGNQVAMHVSKPKRNKNYAINIQSCMPPNVAQL